VGKHGVTSQLNLDVIIKSRTHLLRQTWFNASICVTELTIVSQFSVGPVGVWQPSSASAGGSGVGQIETGISAEKEGSAHAAQTQQW